MENDVQTCPSAVAEKETKGYKFVHCMLRIKDPKPSLKFYCEMLGMSLIHRMDSEQGRFTNYFLSYDPKGEAPKDDPEGRRKWLWAKENATLELCHNWGTETDENFSYHNGNQPDSKGFGHICFVVPNLQEACDRLEQHGVPFQKKPHEGSMRTIAFVRDPDNYWVELVCF